MRDERQPGVSPFNKRTLVPLSEAMTVAASLGLGAKVRCGLVLREHEMRIGLTTTDADPMLSFKTEGTDTERWLSEREQSGPDRWDYFAPVTRTTERFFLRLTMGNDHADVPIEPVAVAVLAEHGWTDDVSVTAEACVDRDAFVRSARKIGAILPASVQS